MQTLKEQAVKIDRTRFLQLMFLTMCITALVLGALSTLIVSVLYGLAIFLTSVFVGVGCIFVLAVGLGYNPNKREHQE